MTLILSPRSEGESIQLPFNLSLYKFMQLFLRRRFSRSRVPYLSLPSRVTLPVLVLLTVVSSWVLVPTSRQSYKLHLQKQDISSYSAFPSPSVLLWINPFFDFSSPSLVEQTFLLEYTRLTDGAGAVVNLMDVRLKIESHGNI